MKPIQEAWLVGICALAGAWVAAKVIHGTLASQSGSGAGPILIEAVLVIVFYVQIVRWWMQVVKLGKRRDK